MTAEEPTVAEALRAFREANGLHHDDHVCRVWRFGMGFVTIPLPNFAWRRRAIIPHDVHHMLTGYPCTAAGELQIAAWEFGAGRYPHWGATLLCLPFIVAGVLWAPVDTWEAFQRGRASRSLYRGDLPERLLSLRVSEARRAMLPA